MSPSDVQKAQELVYELQVGEIMTRRLITASPEMTMGQVKTLLRQNRISGLPVLDGNALIGIITIEDLIRALERNELGAPVSAYMTPTVHTIREDELAVRALGVFAQHHVGRLPVVDVADQLVGILTPGDVTRGVLRGLDKAYREEELRRYRVSHLFEDIASDQTSLLLRFDVPARDFRRAGSVSSKIKKTLHRLGFDPNIVRRVVVIAYEAEMNIVIHSASGGNLVAEITPDHIAILAYDQGPGIPDIEKAIQPGYTTAPDWIRQMGFGAGMGLSNIQSCADVMYLNSMPPKGTRLEAIVELNPHREEATDETAPNRHNVAAAG